MTTTALHLIISGRVQGVTFRASTRREALRLGVHGWVRNLPDRRVEAWLEGDPEAVGALKRWCHGGPPLAEVTGVEADEVEPEGLAGFEVRR